VPLPGGLESVAGAQELHDWFGYWPSFHDAEVIEFSIGTAAPSRLLVHTWEMTNRVNEQGHYDARETIFTGHRVLNI
jgi:hypothetical protein